jgi:predicted PolB exonuclease-like 3'-5' exonuclease
LSGSALGSFTGQAKVKLDVLAKVLGLPGKPQGIDGGQVEELAQAGRLAEIAQYCESDVLNTYRVWLIHELFRGSITTQKLEWSEAQAREFVGRRRPLNPHLIDAMGVQG